MNEKTFTMMNILSFGPLRAALCGLVLLAGACSPRGPVQTFAEASDPTADTLADWSAVAPGLHASWGTTDVRYRRSVVPDSLADGCALTAWRGERVSAQLVLWTAEAVNGVTCRVRRFRGETGGRLPAGIASARFVRYVLTDEFGPGCGYRTDGDFPTSLAADMLDTLDRFDLAPRTARPVWVTVDVPADAPAGLYRADVEIRGGGRRQHLPLTLTVQPRTLPEPSEWAFHLDLWQHPAAAARVAGVPCWSEAHFALLRPLVRRLAEAGQKVITATLNKDPWNHQCYDAYEDMIRWACTRSGNWEYDYTVFDRWVELCMEEGITRQINCYSLLPWNNELHYYDYVRDEVVDVQADPGTPEFERMWIPFLRNFVRHLREKGWLERCCIAMDERSPETMDRALGLVRRVAPELGVAMADNHASYKRYTDLRDVCVQIDCRVEEADLEQRRRDSLVTTYYVCCSSAFPNTFTFSRPWEAAWMPWFAAARGYDGLLRWAYNSWVADPERDSRFTAWPAGDTYIVYPGNRSSIRFERLREGIQDYEKIRLLRAALAADPSSEAAARLRELEAAVARFDALDAAQPWPERLRAARGTLARLSE